MRQELLTSTSIRITFIAVLSLIPLFLLTTLYPGMVEFTHLLLLTEMLLAVQLHSILYRKNFNRILDEAQVHESSARLAKAKQLLFTERITALLGGMAQEYLVLMMYLKLAANGVNRADILYIVCLSIVVLFYSLSGWLIPARKTEKSEEGWFDRKEKPAYCVQTGVLFFVIILIFLFNTIYDAMN